MALNDDLESTLWTALYNTIANETNISTAGIAGAGTNPAGRLQTVADVQKSIDLWTERLPAIGVQSMGWKAVPYATHTDLLTVTFNILAAAKSTLAKPNLADAYAQLQPILDDGAGNGISAILRDPTHFTLGVAGVIKSKVEDMKRDWEVTRGQESQVFAYALYTYTVTSQVFIGSS